MTTNDTVVAEPAHVRAAPPHPNPYPYYGRLVRGQPVFWDEANGCWVVASAAAVNEVLASELCLTRPPGETVPATLRDGPMAEIFGRLVRLRNDEMRGRLKIAIAAALRSLDLGTVADLTRTRATELDAELGLPLDENQITRFMFALPVQVTAQLLGIPRQRYGDMMSWLGDYGVATAAAGTGIPAPDAALFARGHRAAQALIDLVGALRNNPGVSGPLLDALAREARRAGCDNEADIIANAIGYLAQGYAATASLIGLTLLALARHPSLRAEVEANRALLREVIQEVLRCDPTTNSTFRFMARDGVIAGQQMRQGDMIIVLIAAANRDGALNGEPDRFAISRKDRKIPRIRGRRPRLPGRQICPADRHDRGRPSVDARHSP